MGTLLSHPKTGSEKNSMKLYRHFVSLESHGKTFIGLKFINSPRLFIKGLNYYMGKLCITITHLKIK